MIDCATFLGVAFMSMFLAYFIGYIINGIFSVAKILR